MGYRMLHAPMRPNNVDATPYVEVLNEVRRRVPLQDIADMSGISRYELTRISLGQMPRIQPRTADRLRETLLALLPEEVKGGEA